MNAVSIISYSSADEDAVAGLDILRYLVSTSLCHPFIAVAYEDLGDGAADATGVFIKGESQDLDGLNALLAGLGAVNVVRHIAVTTFTEQGPNLDAAAAGAELLGAQIRRLAGVVVKYVDVRLMAPMNSERLRTDTFFSQMGVINLIALAQDQIGEQAIPLRAEAFTPRQRAAHLALELATVAGLWAGMSSAPIDDWTLDGAGTPAVRASFVSSAARVILDSSPNMSEVLDVAKQLPVPTGYQNLPSFSGMEERIAEEVYPNELRYVSRPIDPVDIRGGRLSLTGILTEIGRLPTYAWKPVRDDLNVAGREILINILHESGFDDVAITDDESADHLVTSADIEAIIQSARREADKPRPNPIPGEYWQTLISRLMALFDGGEAGEPVRGEISSGSQVLTDQQRIVLPSRNVDKVVEALGPQPDPVSEESPDEDIASPNLQDDQPEKADTEPADGEPSEDQAAAAPKKKSKAASPSQGEFSAHRTVLTGITGQFQQSKREASRDVVRTTDDLRLTGRSLAEWQNTDIVGLVPWVMGLSLVLIGVAFLVLTGIREPLRDLLPGTVRSVLMVGGSAWILGLALIAILGRSKPTWHRNATIAAVGIGLTVGALAAFADQLLSEMEDPLGFALGAFVTLMAVWGIIEARNGGYPATQRLLQRTLVTFLVVAGLIRWLIPLDPSEPLADLSRLGVAALVAAVLMTILSATVVAIARSQQEYAIAVSADRLRQDRQRLVVATDAERKLESALHQWSWTGASINYVTQYPFGQVKAIEHAPVHLEPLGLLRFQVLELDLAPDGRQALLSGLLSSATTPGWLLAQYNRVAVQFAEREARLRNLPPGSSDDFLPETDPEPLRPNTPSAVRDVSPRVAFARWLNEAKGDEVLAAAVVDSDKVNIYKTLLSFDTNYRLTVVSGPDGLSYPSMSALFSGIVPGTPHLLDPELVLTLFAASDAAQQMQTVVWWPEDLMEAHHGNLGHVVWEKSEPFVRAENAEYLVLQTVRFDRSDSFPFHVLTGTKPPDPVMIDMPEDVM